MCVTVPLLGSLKGKILVIVFPFFRSRLSPEGIIPLSWCGSDYVRVSVCVAAATLCTVSTGLLLLSRCGRLQGLGILVL